jgi:NAD(P)-dependent dehydrogenase (short-subunit alcohol dehydrogenase family)
MSQPSEESTVTLVPVEDLDLTGRRAAVIGGTGGIGRAISHLLAARGAQVRVVGRTFRDAGTPGIEFQPADLSLMRETARAAADLPAGTLDLVVLTTGIIASPRRQETAEGIERDLAVSYLSRFVMLRGIAERLGRARVFVMGFPGKSQLGAPDDLNAERSYRGMAQHMNTVAANEALVLDAAERYPHLEVFGLNPGFVRSDIRANLHNGSRLRHRLLELALTPVLTRAETYAVRITPLLVAPEPVGRSGTMFDRKARAVPASEGMTPAHVAAFTAASSDLLSRAGVTTG